MFGGGQGGKNTFGMTQTGSAGRWVDVTLYTAVIRRCRKRRRRCRPVRSSRHAEARGAKVERGTPPPPGDDTVVEHEYERPKGKMYLYWGCGDTVRAGQPRVLDMATARPEEYGKFFTSRRATQRGAHSAPGRPCGPTRSTRAWSRQTPRWSASTPSPGRAYGGFKFAIGAQQDLMPAIDLKQSDAGGATQLEWAVLPTARAYFIAAMGAKAARKWRWCSGRRAKCPRLAWA